MAGKKKKGKLGQFLESLRLPNNEIVTSNHQTVGNLIVQGFFMLRLLMHPAVHLRFFVSKSACSGVQRS